MSLNYLDCGELRRGSYRFVVDFLPCKLLSAELNINQQERNKLEKRAKGEDFFLSFLSPPPHIPPPKGTRVTVLLKWQHHAIKWHHKTT